MRKLRRLILVLACGTLAWSCTSDALTAIADAMVDTGNAVRDAASDAAAAQEVHEVTCDIERTWNVVAADGSSVENTYLFAEYRDPTIDAAAVTDVAVRTCDQVFFGTTGAPAVCPTGATCSGEPRLLPQSRCYAGNGAFVDDGVVRVFCGTRITSTTAAGAATTNGQRWSTVRIALSR